MSSTFSCVKCRNFWVALAGFFHVFPKGESIDDLVKKPIEKPIELPKEEKGGVAIGTIMAFVMSAISVLFITISTEVVSDKDIELYTKIAVIIPIAIFILAYRKFNERWFWQEEKKK